MPETEVTIWCSECNSTSTGKERMYCEVCFEGLQDEVKEAQAEVESKDREIEELNGRVGELTGQIEEKDRTISDLEDKISDLESEERRRHKDET